MAHDIWRPEAPPINAFAFDLEGTLVDLEALHFLAFERAMDDLGYPITTREIASMQGAIGGGDPYIAALLGDRFRIEPGDILQRTRQHFEEAVYDEPMTPRLGAIEVIDKIRCKGYKVAIGSLTPRDRGRLIIRRSGLDGYFSGREALFLEDVLQAKPSPEVWQKTAALHGIHPRQQIVLEDSVPGVCAAKAAGSKAFAVPSSTFHHAEHLTALRNAGAQEIFMSWDEARKYFDSLL